MQRQYERERKVRVCVLFVHFILQFVVFVKFSLFVFLGRHLARVGKGKMYKNKCKYLCCYFYK